MVDFLFFTTKVRNLPRLYSLISNYFCLCCGLRPQINCKLSVTYRYAPLGASPSACILSALIPPQSSHCCVYLVLTQMHTFGMLFRLYAIPPQRLAYGSLYGVTYKIVPLGTLNSASARLTRSWQILMTHTVRRIAHLSSGTSMTIAYDTMLPQSHAGFPH
jgi:hypothetical protein